MRRNGYTLPAGDEDERVLVVGVGSARGGSGQFDAEERGVRIVGREVLVVITREQNTVVLRGRVTKGRHDAVGFEKVVETATGTLNLRRIVIS